MKTCQQCNNEFKIVSTRAWLTQKFCSNVCRGLAQAESRSGENSWNWTGGERTKICLSCGEIYTLKPNQPITTFRKQKFCSRPCADRDGFRYEGEAHPNWKADSRRKAYRGKTNAWRRKVIARDHATCQHCGIIDVELHAHHLQSFATHPELRWEVSNGLTLCRPCHYAIHAASTANGVNSGEVLRDNPEPSFERKLVEGATTRDRAYGQIVYGSNISTSALPERDDIVCSA